MPTQKDVLEYGRASVHVTDMRRAQEIRVALEPSGELWQKLLVSTEGYAEGSSIPIVHKDAAVVEVLAQVSALEDEPDPED